MTQDWTDKRVLVTGGTGFIGSHLVDRLSSMGADVYSISRNNPGEESNFSLKGLEEKCKVITMDLSDPNAESVRKLLHNERIDYVFHLAGQPILGVALKYPLETLKTNTLALAGILEGCRLLEENNNKKLKGIVVSSSINVYGGASLPYDENSPLLVQTDYPYEASILAAESIGRFYGKTYNLPIGIARISNVYGPGDVPARRLVPKAISKILEDKEFSLTHNGEVKRNFVHVGDIVDGMVAIAANAQKLKFRAEIFNLGSEEPNTTLEVIEGLIRASGRDYRKLSLTNEGGENERTDQYFNISKAMRVLGWRPQHNLLDGLRETFRWYQEHHKI